MNDVAPSGSFWENKRVLLTGHSGFKGSWLALWLNRLGADVMGVSLKPDSTPNLHNELKLGDVVEERFADIRDAAQLSEIVSGFQPEIVLHLAAQALVRASYKNPLETFETNIMGTANLLEAIRQIDTVRLALMVTTDKVYQNHEWVYPYREDDRLGGHDPYSASKAASELVIASYRDAYLASSGVSVVSVRAGNVIGGGDWADDRLIPDAVRSWQHGQPLVIRNPDSTRPWQHVLEPLAGYLKIAEKVSISPNFAGAYNLGPDPAETVTVREVIELARSYFPDGSVEYGDSEPGLKEAGLLALDTSKARHRFTIAARWNLQDTVERTLSWYRNFYAGSKARDLCLSDIEAYESA